MSAASVRDENRGSKETRSYYEVHRDCEPGKRDVVRLPVIEKFHGLDRARLAALGYALDGPTSTDDRFTGTVRIYRLMAIGETRVKTELVDVLDERVAFRLLNELSFPRADQLAVPVERLQDETNRLARMGF